MCGSREGGTKRWKRSTRLADSPRAGDWGKGWYVTSSGWARDIRETFTGDRTFHCLDLGCDCVVCTYVKKLLHYTICTSLSCCLHDFLGGSGVKSLPATQETRIQSLDWDYPLEKGMAAHSSILAWRIPMDQGAWRATVQGIAENRTQLSD